MRDGSRMKAGGYVVAVALMLGGCTQQVLPPYTAADGQIVPAYRLGAGDRIKIETFGETALTGEFEVAGSGEVDMPLLGAVPAAGRTTVELSSAIMDGLRSRGFLKDPKVSVQMLTYRPFYILGEVAKPGAYPFSNGMTVLNAVATAAGFTYRANTRRIFIRRMGEAGEQEVPLTAATPVMPGDTIRIGERHF